MRQQHNRVRMEGLKDEVKMNLGIKQSPPNPQEEPRRVLRAQLGVREQRRPGQVPVDRWAQHGPAGGRGSRRRGRGRRRQQQHRAAMKQSCHFGLFYEKTI